MNKFDWHSGMIDRSTPVTDNYKSTQNVRRFLKAQCGASFKFDRSFMAWIRSGVPKTMGDVADEWIRRKGRGLKVKGPPLERAPSIIRRSCRSPACQ